MNQLDISRIQAASPYTVEEVANGIYLFETDHDVLYKIELEEDAPIGGCDTYQFYINNVRHVHAERDTKVKQTVMAILIEFFRVNASVVLYVCDTSDGRQRKRSLLFQRWFQEYDHADQFTILFGCIRDENTDNYVGHCRAHKSVLPARHRRFQRDIGNVPCQQTIAPEIMLNSENGKRGGRPQK